MDKLPDEVVLRVAEHLDVERHEADGCGASQQGLAGLVRASKHYNRLLTPLLFDRPLLASRKQAARLVATFSPLVNPWTRAAARGGDWSPKLVTVSELNISFPSLPLGRPTPTPARSLPRIPPALEDLGVFSCLTGLTLHRCRLDLNFLPFLLGPTKPLRASIKDLDISSCLLEGQGEDFPYERSLDFLLQALHLVEDSLESVDFDALRPERTEHEEEDDEDEDDDDWVDAALDAVYDRGDTDFEFFCRFWTGEGDGCPPIGSWINYSAFDALRILVLAITKQEQLYLIVYTSTFPCLRHLTLESRTFFSLDFEDLQTLRRSITDRRGVFHVPDIWDEEDLNFLRSQVGVQVTADKVIPPLCAQEVYPLGEYDGPRLDVLDTRLALITVGL
ncbi:hypothetical protein JCM10213_001007 [Rhodosporidiobolus nylandii]